MKKKINFLMMVLSLVAGMSLFSGCSNNDDKDTPVVVDNQDVKPTEERSEVEIAVQELNANMSGFDFKELEPLSQAVNQSIREREETRGDLATVLDEFQQRLSSLLDILSGDISLRVPYGMRFNYQSYNDALDLSWELAGTLKAGRESDTYFLGKHTNSKGEAVYTASDGSVYTITAEFDKDVNIKNWSYTVTGARQLLIYKNEALLLRIVTDHESDRPLYNLFKVRDWITGDITYLDYDVTFTYDHPHTHERNAVLTYSKVGSDTPLITMTTNVTDDGDIFDFLTHDATYQADFTVKALEDKLIVVGKSNNVNWMVVHGAQLIMSMEKGTTEEECNSLVNDFNNDLSLSVYLTDFKVGDMYMATVYDSATGLFKPTVMVHTTLLQDDLDVLTVMASMGVKVPDILSIAKLIEN